MLLLPLRQIRQQTQRIAPIPDKIIVHEEYGASPTKIMEPLKFVDHLGVGFGPCDAAKELGNIAPFTFPGATAAKLYRLPYDRPLSRAAHTEAGE